MRPRSARAGFRAGAGVHRCGRVTTSPRFLIIGNPANRRVSLFLEALAEQGLEADVVAWVDLLRSFSVLEAIEGPRLVRIDSYGEDFAVERELLRRGGFPDAETVPERHGEVLAPALSYLGFQGVLRELDAFFATRPEWQLLHFPKEIDELFDKRRTSRRFLAAGVPVPEFLEEVPSSPSALLDAVRARGWRQIFVKPTMGSSASGVLLVSLTDAGATIRTSLEWEAPRWFNNLRLSHYRTKAEVDRALGFVLALDAQVELAIPKARLGGAYFDCRVLCIAGEPRFVVVRQNKHPITNPHLGGWRGEVSALQAAMPEGAWEAAMDSCRKVASLYRSLQLGLDVMFEPGLARHRVIEANAFGDLLPNLTLEGLSVYGWEIREALRASPAP